MDEEPRPPGWYVRPEMVNTQGYWDGEKWTEQTQPLPPRLEDSTLVRQMGSNVLLLAGLAVFLIAAAALLRHLA